MRIKKSCFKSVGLPTLASIKPFFSWYKNNFPGISCPLGGFCLLGRFLEAISKRREGQKSAIFFVDPSCGWKMRA
jgi:hypothetical protein